MTSGFLLSFSDLASLSPAAQAEILSYLQSQTSPQEAGSASSLDPDDVGYADLSPAQARKFLERCSDKTRDALKTIAGSQATGFKMADITKALSVDHDTSDLRGVWGGITKRVRTVLDDPEAFLIWWVEQGQDWVGRVSPMTHQSLRKAFDF